jgi:phosphate acetyltransferase
MAPASVGSSFDQQGLSCVPSGDVIPTRVDEAYAKGDVFYGIVSHNMWIGASVSTLLGTQLPGPGTYVSQSLSFRRPAGLGDKIVVSVAVRKKEERNRVLPDCQLVRQKGEVVLDARTASRSRGRCSMAR